MEKRRDRRSKARRGSERRHWSRYFYGSNAQKPDSTQRIERHSTRRAHHQRSSKMVPIIDGSPNCQNGDRHATSFRSSSCSSFSSSFLELGLPKPRTSVKISSPPSSLTKSR